MGICPSIRCSNVISQADATFIEKTLPRIIYQLFVQVMYLLTACQTNSTKVIQKMENAMKLHGLHVRIEETLVDGMKVLKSRTRKPMGIIIEEALREYLKKHDIQLEQPKADV